MRLVHHNEIPACGGKQFSNVWALRQVDAHGVQTFRPLVGFAALLAKHSEGSRIRKEAQAAYGAGEVTREEVETLTGYAGDRSRHLPQKWEDGTVSELLARQLAVRVRSRLLGEVVVWVADTVVPEATAEVVYKESELRRLVKMPPDQIRAIHAVKKELDGECSTPGVMSRGRGGVRDESRNSRWRSYERVWTQRMRSCSPRCGRDATRR